MKLFLFLLKVHFLLHLWIILIHCDEPEVENRTVIDKAEDNSTIEAQQKENSTANFTVDDNSSIVDNKTISENITNDSQDKANETAQITQVESNQSSTLTVDHVYDNHTQEQPHEVKENSTAEPPKSEEFNLTYEIEKDKTPEADTEDEYNEQGIDRVEQDKLQNEEEEEEIQLRKDWENQVANFTASNMLTVKVRSGRYEILYEEVIEPTVFKIAYIVNNENKKIDFSIVDPQRRAIFKVKGKGYLYYEYRADDLGVYEFIIDNDRYSDEKRVTFAINSGSPEEQKLDSEHLDKFFAKIVKVDNKLNEVKMRQSFVVKKREGHFETIKSHNKKIVVYSLIECGTMLIIFVVQTIYIKHLLSKVN